jgi:hypothetical protein
VYAQQDVTRAGGWGRIRGRGMIEWWQGAGCRGSWQGQGQGRGGKGRSRGRREQERAGIVLSVERISWDAVITVGASVGGYRSVWVN